MAWDSASAAGEEDSEEESANFQGYVSVVLGTDRALGSVLVFSRGGEIGETAELGYQFFPSARGRGAAKEAARLAVRHALTPAAEGGLGVRRLVAETAADNEASNAVLRSVGFVEFGREHAVDRLADGSWSDALHWELLP